MATYEKNNFYLSDFSQVLANKLPEWSKIRKQRQSVGQHLLNSMWGLGLEKAVEKEDLFIRENILVLADKDVPDVVTKLTIPETVSINKNPQFKNYLKNSYFEIFTVPHKTPDYWVVTGKAEESSTSLIGHRSLKLTVDDLSTTTIYQDIDVQGHMNDTWTFSLFYRIPSNTLTAPNSNFGITITSYRTDGFTETSYKSFSATTDDVWKRIEVNHTLLQNSSKIRVSVSITDTSSFDFQNYYCLIDCLQLEIGTKATSWQARIDDKPNYLDTEEISPVFIDKAFYVEDSIQFWKESLPTRASYIGSNSNTSTAVTTAGVFDVTDVFGVTTRFTFEIYNNSLRKRAVDNTSDVLREFELAFYRYDGKYEDGHTYTLEAITYFADKLWVILTAPDFNGTTKRYLYVVNYKHPWPAPTYLEVITGVEIPSNVPIGTPIIATYFKLEDRQHIFLNDGTTEYIVRLHYDFYVVDIPSRTILMREQESNTLVV